MGTVVSFLVDPGARSEDDAGRLVEEACAELHRIDEQFSPWRADSELSRRRRDPSIEPSDLMREVSELCEVARDMSGGYFDPWALPDGFDPTGLVKGWAAERALAVLAQGGVGAALVNAGGDICVLPGQRYDVGVQHPTIPDALCAVVQVDTCVASSGVYARGEHLINPLDGRVAAVSATVMGGRLAYADALATALAVGGPKVLHRLEAMAGIEGFFITQDGVLFKTRGMALGVATLT